MKWNATSAARTFLGRSSKSSEEPVLVDIREVLERLDLARTRLDRRDVDARSLKPTRNGIQHDGGLTPRDPPPRHPGVCCR